MRGAGAPTPRPRPSASSFQSGVPGVCACDRRSSLPFAASRCALGRHGDRGRALQPAAGPGPRSGLRPLPDLPRPAIGGRFRRHQARRLGRRARQHEGLRPQDHRRPARGDPRLSRHLSRARTRRPPAEPAATAEAAPADGAAVFQATCIACHQAEGEGQAGRVPAARREQRPLPVAATSRRSSR